MSAPHSQDHAHDMRIFMSHSKDDNVLGVRLAEDLRRVLGDPAAVWYDSSGRLHPGVGWWQTIIKEVRERPIFLVIWSPAASDSEWVNDEIDLAWLGMNDPGGKTIIPLIWRPCEMRDDLRTRRSFARPSIPIRAAMPMGCLPCCPSRRGLSPIARRAYWGASWCTSKRTRALSVYQGSS
jgi:hypothetical protein